MKTDNQMLLQNMEQIDNVIILFSVVIFIIIIWRLVVLHKNDKNIP